MFRLIAYRGFESPSLRHPSHKGFSDSQKRIWVTNARLGHSMAISTSLAALIFAFTLPAHAGSNAQGPHGGIAAARGLAASRAASHASASAQSGQGGSYWTSDPNASLVDAYQPYPEAEMRQFQKPHWEPYQGE